MEHKEPKKKDIMQSEVTSVIRVFGSSSELSRLRKLVDTNGLGFDFDLVLKPPYGLNNMSVDDVIEEDEEISRLTTYGATDILEWRKLYWGTEWTNLGTSWFNNGYMKMKTVNDPAIGVLKHLTIMFEVKLSIVFSDGRFGGVMLIEKGRCASELVENEEAEVANHLIEDTDSSYQSWESSNKKAGKSKKLEMELLFNYDTPFLTKVKKIIDPSNKKMLHADGNLVYK